MLARHSGGGTESTRSEVSPEDVRDPDAVAQEVLALLGKERYRSARSLAAEALARFPDHARVRGIWGIFENRGKAKISPLGAQPSTDEEFEWLKHPPEWAAGKWVALVGSEAVASADTLAELEEAIDSMNLPKMPLAARIDAI